MLRQLPRSTNPNLLVGFETKDDAGVYRVADDFALVQTIDFFTPVVDDPYAYGQIAAANALSDIYAMGGRPLTVLNIACFDPTAAPAHVWAEVLLGSYDKCLEAGATVMGGHTVEDPMPKFGLSVTGLIDPRRIFGNANAQPGEHVWLSKPLGTGIVTTAAKYDKCSSELLAQAVESMATLNAVAMERAHRAGVRCATDITGYGLAGHLYNIAKASEVTIEVFAESLPVFPGVERLVALGAVTGGAAATGYWLREALFVEDHVPYWFRELILDPQTSGGLAVTARQAVEGSVCIGRVLEGPASVRVV